MIDGADATIDIVASKLPQPWGIAFLPDGSALVTERKSGNIVKIGEPQTTNGLTVATLTTVPGIDTSGEGGLLGVAVSPHYATDKTIFVYYSTTTDNRVAALTPGKVPRVILAGIPHGILDNGGALAFGPDGYLYAATGDAGHVTGGVAAPSQNPQNLAGKILRMTTSGKPAPGNPTKSSLVYARGFHDVEGLAWDRQKHLFVVDASHTADGLDLVTPGANYGWPIAGTAQVPVTATIRTPIQTWPLSQSTCAGVATIGTIVATACLMSKQLWLVQLTTNAVVFGAPGATLTGKFGRLRGIAAAPDGSLWITTSNTDGHGTPGATDDRVLRVVLADEGAGRS